MEIKEEIRKFVEEEFAKPNACDKELFEKHFILVVRYSRLLAKEVNADSELVEIVAWLHDIGSIRGFREEHHIVGARIAEELLTSLKYPREKIERVKHCILSHRGSKNVKNHTLRCMACEFVWFLSTSKIKFAFSRTKVGSLHKFNFLSIKREIIEAQILADADAMAHFDDIGRILARIFNGNKQKMRDKLIRSYNKISNESKNIIKPKFEEAMHFLEENGK